MIFEYAGPNSILLALLATLFTYGVTVAGATLVFFFKSINRKALDMMLGLAAGIMIAASFWSLLEPSIALAEASGVLPWWPAVVGFLMGAGFLFALDKMLPHMHRNTPKEQAEGMLLVKALAEDKEATIKKKHIFLLVMAITIHNIPEGLAVGFAFGAVGSEISGATLGDAIAVAIGIGIQNFPEGTAVSVPLRREGLSRKKSFFWGQLSGIVEPIAGIIGAFVVLSMIFILPYALAFAAGAMIFVVIEEIIPEAISEGNGDIATLGAILGFAIMMLLDVALS